MIWGMAELRDVKKIYWIEINGLNWETRLRNSEFERNYYDAFKTYGRYVNIM